jgi:hypothetical protein
METYLRMMFLKFRYRLGYETLCREVGDSISWQRFCRIPVEEVRFAATLAAASDPRPRRVQLAAKLYHVAGLNLRRGHLVGVVDASPTGDARAGQPFELATRGPWSRPFRRAPRRRRDERSRSRIHSPQ